MKIINPSVEMINTPRYDDVLRVIESAARNCYQSELKGNPESFIREKIKSGHHSVIEHVSITAKITCDRGVMAELTRHRLAAFSIESTRYANYSKDKFGNEITVIKPFFWHESSVMFADWRRAMVGCETAYLDLINNGATAQEARSVLPNSLKTEIVMSANLREWRHVMKLRCSQASHPQMREVALLLLAELNARLPVFFADIYGIHAWEINR